MRFSVVGVRDYRRRSEQGAAAWLVLAAWACLAGCGQVLAGESSSTEVRRFAISVDGDRCGTFQLTIDNRADGRAVVSGDAALELKYVVYTFRYTSKGSETWNDGRLEKLDYAARYGNNKYLVSAQPKGEQLAVKVNKKQRTIRSDVWVTSYWHEPPAESVGQTVSLFDADKGRLLSAKVESLGNEPLRVGSAAVDCPHYRLSGDVAVDVWYDAQGHLARQETVDTGHRTRLDLLEIKR